MAVPGMELTVKAFGALLNLRTSLKWGLEDTHYQGAVVRLRSQLYRELRRGDHPAQYFIVASFQPRRAELLRG